MHGCEQLFNANAYYCVKYSRKNIIYYTFNIKSFIFKKLGNPR